MPVSNENALVDGGDLNQAHEALVVVEALTKVYASSRGDGVLAVDNVTFQVRSGEVYGLLGPNGAGKTTTIRMILGLLKPTKGQAWISGHRADLSPDEVKRRVGLVSASTGVYPWLSAREVLEYFADLYDVEPAQAAQNIERLSATFGLTGLLDRRCATFSTGQKQRLNLARALAHDPPVLLLDEPTLGLDVVGRQVVNEFIGLLRNQGKAVILCTHHLDEAERLCDRFGLLHQGQLVSQGTLEDLRQATGKTTLVDMFLDLAKVGPALTTDINLNLEPSPSVGSPDLD